LAGIGPGMANLGRNIAEGRLGLLQAVPHAV